MINDLRSNMENISLWKFADDGTLSETVYRLRTFHLQNEIDAVYQNSWAFCTEHAPNLARNPWGEGVKFNMAAYE